MSPDSSVGGTVRTRFGLFKLDDAPLEDNAGKAVEVFVPPEEKNTEAKNNKEPKRKIIKKMMMKLVDSLRITNIQPYSIITTRARLDWEACKLMIRNGDKKIKILTEYCKPANIGDQILRKAKLKKEKKAGDKDVDIDSSKSEEKEETGSNDESKNGEYKEETRTLDISHIGHN
ncbi:hypothetical protein C2G38_2199639 [Gigaspora rosea]|uniref:Uncharacterized protein n=1 Tax=Gigaspora rosea TaxID=44941 RepID=A0A397UTW1_9GLOM|nr:hypothetical protein C2G38_2199639 [Gigaspora rosea]